MKNKNNIIFVILSICFINFSVHAQWIKLNSPAGPAYSITFLDSVLYSAINYKVFRSTNFGLDWIEVKEGLTTRVLAMASDGSNVYAGAERGAFMVSNYDTTWTSISNGLDRDPYVDILTVNGSELYAGVLGYTSGGPGGVYLSKDKGSNWSLLPGSTHWALSVGVFGENIFVGQRSNRGLNQRSTDHGKTWHDITYFNFTYVDMQTFAGDVSDIFAGTNQGVYLSTDNGINWEKLSDGLNNNLYHNVGYLYLRNNNLFAVIGGKLFLSNDNGNNWHEISLNLPLVYTVNTDNSNVYAGTSDGIWRRPLSEITSIKEFSSNIPVNYRLEQNYPNPFNPYTTITYSIPKGSNIIIRIYNNLGEEVKTLIDVYKMPGKYQLNFEATTLASGVYFYQLKANGFIITKKMVLLR